jgi:hypothetical protein
MGKSAQGIHLNKHSKNLFLERFRLLTFTS